MHPTLKLVSAMNAQHASQPRGMDGSAQDAAIDDARANDVMRDDLWQDWVARGKQGPNPDTMPTDSLSSSYRAMRERERQEGSAMER